MNGETVLIVQDLKAGSSIDEVAKKYKKTPGNIRKLAHRHHVFLQKPKKLDYLDDIFVRDDIPMPNEGYQAAKLSGLAKCNDAWAKRVGGHKLSEYRACKENGEANYKYGLRFPS